MLTILNERNGKSIALTDIAAWSTMANLVSAHLEDLGLSDTFTHNYNPWVRRQNTPDALLLWITPFNGHARLIIDGDTLVIKPQGSA